MSNILPYNVGIIHFTGIGGIGMSGIAEVLLALGCEVQGSDIAENPNIERLRKIGIKVIIGQEEVNIENIAVVVRSSAVGDNNPEIVAARKHHIPVIARAEMLAEIMRFKSCVAVAGTHGKTTTTSIIASLFEGADLHPTVVNGGIINARGTNAYLGKGQWLIAEADESDGSFVKLPSNIAVITNIDPEHMEHYGSFENLKASFKRFVENIPFYGFAVMCKDHPEVKSLMLDITDRKVISYGIEEQDVDVRAVNIKNTEGGYNFDVEINIDGKEQYSIKQIFLPMYGKHNILNSLAAISIAIRLGFKEEYIIKSLADFMGVKRRLTVTGVVNGITIIDDYGHHPVEIAASLAAVKEMQNGKGRVIAVVQPHRYSRILALFNQFASCFADSDVVLVTDVYAAGEEPIEGVDKQAIMEAIQKHGHADVQLVESLANLADYVKKVAHDGDVVLCLGAGDITKYANNLPAGLK